MSVKCTTVSGQVFEGSVFAIDPVTLSIIIRDAESAYHVLGAAQITKLEGDLSKFSGPNVGELGINIHALEKMESKAMDAAERNIAALNSSVAPEIQTLFDRLNFIFPCSWQGSSMVVLNEFIIDPPYDQVRSRAAADQPTSPGGSATVGLSRVVKVLEGERRKLKL